MTKPVPLVCFLAVVTAFTVSAGEVAFDSGWKTDGTASEVFEIQGTGVRSNPVRRQLDKPFSGDELFVSFELEYPGDHLDTADKGDGEFFVFWFDQLEGGDTATHSTNVPNIGLHVDKDLKNRFMVRYRSGGESFAAEVLPDKRFVVTGRLWKSVPSATRSFDRLDLWVDPKEDEEFKPHASTVSSGSSPVVKWIGFSTGRKTEPGDRIRVSNVRLADSWRSALRLPDLTEAVPKTPAEPEPPRKLAHVEPPPQQIVSDHWAFQPIERPKVPSTGNDEWARNDIDRFISAHHKELGVLPAPPADDFTLARRLSLVLTGLPPVEGQDVEGMLGSQEFGERWGRHWLDVARWAESNGHQHNRDRPNAWRYRDYVIAAFRDNKPYDQFVREQLAGDELEDWNPDHIVATGFLAAARYSGNNLDKEIQRNEILVDVTNTTGEAFLGLTMACAQCHDHFFDPVTAWDYYGLQAFFAKAQPGNVVIEGDAADLIEQRWGIFDSVHDRLVNVQRKSGTPEPILVSPETVEKKMTVEEKLRFGKIDGQLKEFSQTWAYVSPKTSPHHLQVAPHEMRWPLPRDPEMLAKQKVHYLVRGDVGTPGPGVEPAWPQVFGESDVDGNHPRLSLANWIASGENPLTARVWANRLWQWVFGEGLVETSGNLGVQGTEPANAALLDWLASELIDSGWDTRRLIRLMVDSSTFRQSSRFSASNQDRDPDNASLWRWMPRRLEGEAIRDSVLALSGKLDSRSGGPSDASSSQRRSVYLRQKRDNLPEQQMLFDSPNGVTSCARRLTSTVALQPLWLLNSEFMNESAQAIAANLPEREREQFLVERIVSRPPEEEEIEVVRKLSESQGWERAALTLLNTNEFLYIP